MSDKGKIWRLVGWLLLFKVASLIIVTAACYLFPAFDLNMFGACQRWPRSGDPTFASHFATWDVAHYLYLSEIGYSSGVSSCAFYPLWPFMMRVFSVVTGGSHLVAGMILANLFSICGWVLFYKIVCERFGEKAARMALILLIVFPGSIFFQFAYTESLFFLLLMVLWRGMEKDQNALIFLAAFLLPLTRAIGLFCVLPIAWHLYGKWCASLWARWRQLSSSKELASLFWPALEPAIRRSWLIFVPLCGWALYLSLMWCWTGNAFEGFAAQKFWGVHSVWNIINIPKFIYQFADIVAFHEFTGSFLDRIVFLVLFYTLILIWRQGKDMFVWTIMLGLIPAFSGDLTSFTRFCSVAFPLFVALGAFFSGISRRWGWLYVGCCVALHGVLLWRFVNFHWAG